MAEGQKQSEILKAEGDRQAAILRAEGFREALTQIFSAAKGIDQKTMALQYLEALKALGASPSTKFVIPTEFTRLIEPFTGFLVQGHGPGTSSIRLNRRGERVGQGRPGRYTRHVARAAGVWVRLTDRASGWGTRLQA